MITILTLICRPIIWEPAGKRLGTARWVNRIVSVVLREAVEGSSAPLSLLQEKLYLVGEGLWFLEDLLSCNLKAWSFSQKEQGPASYALSILLEPSVPTLFLRSVLIVVFNSHVHFTVHLIFFLPLTVTCLSLKDMSVHLQCYSRGPVIPALRRLSGRMLGSWPAWAR